MSLKANVAGENNDAVERKIEITNKICRVTFFKTVLDLQLSADPHAKSFHAGKILK